MKYLHWTSVCRASFPPYDPKKPVFLQYHTHINHSLVNVTVCQFSQQVVRQRAIQRWLGLSVVVKDLTPVCAGVFVNAWRVYVSTGEWRSADMTICRSCCRSAPPLRLPHGWLAWKNSSGFLCFCLSLRRSLSLSYLYYLTFSSSLPPSGVWCLFVACGVFSQNYHQTQKKGCRGTRISFNMLSKTAALRAAHCC